MTRLEQLDKQIARLRRRGEFLNAISRKYWTARRIIFVAGALLELSGKCTTGSGVAYAKDTLESGKAYQKFIRICEAQGGFKEPPAAPKQFDILAEKSGEVTSIDNRTLARIAKLAGAPKSPSAGIQFLSPLGRTVSKGDLLYTIHAESDGELNYARNYASSTNPVVTIL